MGILWAGDLDRDGKLNCSQVDADFSLVSAESRTMF